MTLRREGKRRTRTQRATIAALLARLRTKYCAAQCVLAAGTSLFSSLLEPGEIGLDTVEYGGRLTLDDCSSASEGPSWEWLK